MQSPVIVEPGVQRTPGSTITAKLNRIIPDIFHLILKVHAEIILRRREVFALLFFRVPGLDLVRRCGQIVNTNAACVVYRVYDRHMP